jgi:hypothetical protein
LEENFEKSLKINKVYTVQDEINLFGYLISDLLQDNADQGINNLAERTKRNLYSLEEIILHPILKSVEGYFSYIIALSNLTIDFDFCKRFHKEFIRTFGLKELKASPFCNSAFRMLPEKYKKQYDLIYVNGYIKALFFAYRNSSSILINPYWAEHSSNYVQVDEFLKRLQCTSKDVIEKIHFTLLKMQKKNDSYLRKKISVSLCLPGAQD